MNDYKKIEQNDYNNLPSKEGKYKVVSYNINGNISIEQYLINNKFHREDGPVWISYFENGNVYNEGYYLCNKYFSKENYYSPKIQTILDIAKDMDTWEQRFNFIKKSIIFNIKILL